MRISGALLLSLYCLLPAPEPIPGPAPAPSPVGDREEPGAPSAPDGGSTARRVTVEQQNAIDAGLAYLATQQTVDGGFPTHGAGDTRAKSADYQTAVTSLSLLAFLGAGHGLRHGPYHEKVSRAVRWLKDSQQKSGLISFANDNQSKMHGHGFATLALAEAYASATSDARPETVPETAEAQALRSLCGDLRTCIQDAVNCIQDAQSASGGWDYLPSSGGTSDHEGSVTVCQVQALLAASNRGFNVNLPRIKNAREYMRKSQVACGGFKYKLSTEDAGQDPSHFTYALAAAGVTSLVGLGEYDRRDAVEQGMQFLEQKERYPSPDRTPYFFYGSFYAVQAFHWAGGARWDRFWVPFRRNLLTAQNPDGSWTGRDTQTNLGNVYPTAFSLLILEVPVEYLSIFAK